MNRYCAVFVFTTQTGPDSLDRVKAVMKCDDLTTVGEIQAWAKSKNVTCPICLSIAPLEP